MVKRAHLFIFLISFFVSLISTTNAFAAQSNVVKTNNVSAQLIADHQSVQAGQSFGLILRIDIRDGWHTYWRNPGDSGQATAIKWQLPEGVTAGEIEWPYPERQFMGPVANYGYHGKALHRVKFHLDQSWPVGKPISIKAYATWLVCEEECIPEKGSFELTIQSNDDAQLAIENKPDFVKIEAQLPVKLDVQSTYQYSGDGQIRFEFSPSEQLVNAQHIEYFPYEWGVLQPPVDQALVVDSTFVSITSQKGDLSFTKPLSGVLVVTDRGGAQRGFEVESSLGALILANISGDSSGVKIGLFSALLFAFLGGLILNLMPCVFPVLSMKAMSLVNHANEPSSVIKRHGLVYTFGVLVSFALLGTCLLILQATGQQIGWGFQLQSPVFVSVIIIVLFILGLSLSGFVELGASLMGLGSGLAQQSGYKGSFFTGVLAVIVATPCTAPFMGPAVGFALTQSPVVTLLVLLALGFGLALPYLVLCYIPVLSKHLPKPGVWMQKLQQFLAFPMYATAVWLIWVLGLQAGINAIFAILISCIFIALAIWLWQNTASATSLWRLVGRNCVLLLFLIVAFAIANIPSVSPQVSVTNDQSVDALYQKFSDERLNELRQEGVPVFVNMTAAWCITCLANEKVALSSDQLKQYFKDNNIVYLKGDWTNQDASITQYLQTFGRSSVPLYVYYPAIDVGSNKDLIEPSVLPQILTIDSVINAMKAADTQIPTQPK